MVVADVTDLGAVSAVGLGRIAGRVLASVATAGVGVVKSKGRGRGSGSETVEGGLDGGVPWFLLVGFGFRGASGVDCVGEGLLTGLPVAEVLDDLVGESCLEVVRLVEKVGPEVLVGVVETDEEEGCVYGVYVKVTRMGCGAEGSENIRDVVLGGVDELGEGLLVLAMGDEVHEGREGPEAGGGTE